MMEIVKNAAVESLEKAGSLFIIYSMGTRQPFVSFDSSIGKDQIFAFTEKSHAEEKMEALEKYGYMVQLAEIPADSRRVAFINYHALGIDQVVYRDAHSTTMLDLDEIQRVDISRIPKQQRPHLNPPLQLTSIYFLQEMSRNVAEDQLTEDDLRARADLEKEFCKYLAKSKYMVPIQMKKLRGNANGSRISQKNFDHIFVTDAEGQHWLPIFSDVTEFEKFNTEGQFQAVLMEFSQLRRLVSGQIGGCLFNPASQGYRLLPEVMDLLIERFGEDENE